MDDVINLLSDLQHSAPPHQKKKSSKPNNEEKLRVSAERIEQVSEQQRWF